MKKPEKKTLAEVKKNISPKEQLILDWCAIKTNVSTKKAALVDNSMDNPTAKHLLALNKMLGINDGFSSKN